MARHTGPARIEILSTQRAIRVPRKRIVELIGFVAKAENANLAEVDISVVTSREIARINRRWVGHAGPTDVISFDHSGPEIAGLAVEIIVCGEVARAEATRRGLGVQKELLLYVLHGLLHMLGYDDRSPADFARMQRRQEQLLAEFMGR